MAKKKAKKRATGKGASKKKSAKRKSAGKAKKRAAKGRPAAVGKQVDLYRERPEYFKTKRTPEILKLKAVKYLAIEGEGEPGGEEFQAAIGALYGVAYTMKFTKKFGEGIDYKVCTFGGQWWSAKGGASPNPFEAPRGPLSWRLLMMVPDFITKSDVEKIKKTVFEKKGGKLEGDETVKRVALEKVNEGLCVQILHVGPYAAETESIAKMFELLEAEGLEPCGRHHEVYLSNPNRVAPEKNRTILRYPVKKVGR